MDPCPTWCKRYRTRYGTSRDFDRVAFLSQTRTKRVTWQVLMSDKEGKRRMCQMNGVREQRSRIEFPGVNNMRIYVRRTYGRGDRPALYVKFTTRNFRFRSACLRQSDCKCPQSRSEPTKQNTRPHYLNPTTTI